MPASSKELVRALFAAKPVSRTPFIPYIATAAAQFMQVPIKQMFSDPTTLANSLQACQRLFKYDGVVILFDDTLEAEACGCQVSWQEGEPPKILSHFANDEKRLDSLDISAIESKGRIPAVLEAAKRLSQTMGKAVALLGVITGPIALSEHLMGDGFVHAPNTDIKTCQKLTDLWAKISLTLARAYGELNFDAVILADSRLALLKPAHYPTIQPMLKTLRNLVNFYNAPLIVTTGHVPQENLPAFSQLEADGFSLGNSVSDIRSLALSTGKIFGAGIPTSILIGSTADVERETLKLLDESGNGRVFITSEWEIARTTPALNIHKVMQVLTSAHVK